MLLPAAGVVNNEEEFGHDTDLPLYDAVNMNSSVIVNSILRKPIKVNFNANYEGWNFNSGNYLFTTDTK